jgi:dTMP kinase
MLREVLLSARSSGMSVEAELCCVFAARAQLLHEVVLPALEAGKVVVSNRFALSSAVYQLARKEREDLRQLYKQLYASVVGELPVHYVLLDCPPEVGLARARGRKGEVSRIDMEDVSIHERVRTAYLKEVQRYPHVVVDAAQEKAVVCEEVSAYIAQLVQH